ncbi:MAG: HlyD family efflux transporter periplasmic adaptor subunit [Clostridiaceae bacterium]|nr:HlyD family efflux transporter periplasmic adaptor subunit [Clostridiaceae bacterium]
MKRRPEPARYAAQRPMPPDRPDRPDPVRQEPLRRAKPAAAPAAARIKARPGAQTAPPARSGARPGSGIPRTPRTSEERLAQIERRKGRSRAASLAILVMLIMLVTFVAIILVMKQSKPRPRFVFLQQGELMHNIDSVGLIARDEAVFNAPADGILKPLTTEGSRVSKSQKLALIIPEGKEEDLKSLQKCENDMIDLQNELMSHGKGAGAKAIYDESAASLAAVINLVRSDASKGSLANLNAYEASLSVIMEQRTSKLMNIDFEDSRLVELKQTQKTLEQSLGLDAGTLICQKPGLVSFKLDGLEGILTLDAAASITAADYQKYIQDSNAVLTVSQTVAKDSPVLRIASNLYQYLIFLLPNTSPAGFIVDQFYSINVPNDGITIENCRVIRSEASGTDALVVFRTDRKVEWLSDRRLIQAELTLSSTTGLKVPLTSLIDFDETAGQSSIMIVINGYTRICKVTVKDHDRESAIIEPIDTETYKPSESNILVVNPDSIEEGEFIGN